MRFQDLNQQQLAAVSAPLGPVAVAAGAGSGKTRVLTYRIKYLVENLDVQPNEILAITFTNKAADEMKKRLLEMDCHAEYMQISTIHSFCAKVLREQAECFNMSTHFSIYTEDDKEKVLKKIMRSHFDEVDSQVIGKFGDTISQIKSNLPDCKLDDAENLLGSINGNDEIKGVFGELSNTMDVGDDIKLAEFITEYTARLNENNALDFDDLLFYTNKLFVEFPDVLAQYRERYKYILIDEFQDVNEIQYNIFKLLAQEHRNIFVVGDDCQSIYSWRGALPGKYLTFKKDFNLTDDYIYMLEKNYRSTQYILKLANDFRLSIPDVIWPILNLTTDNELGVKPQLFEAYDESDEAYFVIEQIKNLRAYNGMRFKDCAILMRVNALSRSFEMQLNANRIPYKVIGGFKFFERREIRDILAYLRLLDNPFDNEAFERALNSPKRRGIGDTTLKKLYSLSADYGLPLIRLISDERNLETISKSISTKLCDFYAELDSFYQFAQKVTIDVLVHKILQTLCFREVYKEQGDDDRALNVDQFEEMVIDYHKSNPTANLSEFLQSVSLMSDTDDIDDSDYVTISTIHSAKGLEFKTVFVVGMEEGIFPKSTWDYSPREENEELCVMYVAITRAIKRLYLTRAKSRFLYGKRDYLVKPSRFFTLAKQFLAPPQPTYSERQLSNDSFLDKLNAKSENVRPVPSTAKSKSQTAEIKVGKIVNHTSFGQGIVLKVDGDIAEIVFDKAGKKALNVRFAPLTVVK